MRQLPSTRSIIWVDQIALFTAILPVISVVMGLLAAAGVLPDLHGVRRAEGLAFVPRDAAGVFYAMAGVGLAAGVALVGWRVGKVRAAFTLGLEVPGLITKITAFKDRAYLDYAFVVGSKGITTRHFVHQTKAVKALQEGQAVTIAVNPRSPKDSFVVEVFETSSRG